MCIKHDNAPAPENKVFIKIANDSQWKLSITMEYPEKGIWQRNKCTKLGFEDFTGKARATMVQANVLEKIKYKLGKEYFNCAAYLINLAVVILNGKIATGYEHFHEANHIMPST